MTIVPGPTAPIEGVPPEHTAAIRHVLGRLGREAAGEPARVPNSAVNANYRVPARGGALFVRLHRHTRTKERVWLEQRAAAFAGDRGLPVVRSLADGAGHTCWRAGGMLVSAFPWLEGRLLVRGCIAPAEAADLGRLQARSHHALASWADPALERSGQLTWDTGETVAALSRVDDLIRYYPAPGEERVEVQRGLRRQLALLEGGAARPPTDFEDLPLQPCHGDFHERNILFDPGAPGRVLAVVDWEMVAGMPPGFDVMRSLSYMDLLEGPLLGAYLRGYREVRELGGAEWARSVECWWQHLLHSAWAVRRTFIDGDERAAEFVGHHHALVGRFADEGFRAQLARA